jgi:MFS family permease
LKTKDQFKLGLAALFLTFFLAALMVYGLNHVAPVIADKLKGMSLFSWAISLPALAGAFVALLFGKLSDMYGRRTMLMVSLVFFMLGTVLSAVSETFEFNIAARVIAFLGIGALAPLCLSILGDLFEPGARSKWTGLIQISACAAAASGPLVGMITDRLGWRFFFWITVPLAIASGILVMMGIPPHTRRAGHKIDFAGSCLLAVATSSMILGFSFADRRDWISFHVLGLLTVSLVSWFLFIWIERRAEEPILDPQVFTNRSFLIAAIAALMSFFGFVGIMNYYPLFLQHVQGTSATLSGGILTPFSILMAFMGVPAGLLLAKTKRCKWMYILGYLIATAATFFMFTFSSATPVWLGILVTAIGGLGLGVMPTINALVVQFALPKRLLAVAVAGIFFVVTLGNSITPAIMGAAMNSTYAKKLQDSLPAELIQLLDAGVRASIADPGVLKSQEAMAELRDRIMSIGDEGPLLYDRTVQGIRVALESSLRILFLIGAMAMLISLLLIIAIPEVSMDMEVQDKKPVG